MAVLGQQERFGTNRAAAEPLAHAPENDDLRDPALVAKFPPPSLPPIRLVTHLAVSDHYESRAWRWLDRKASLRFKTQPWRKA
jgi:hypothetical protein